MPALGGDADLEHLLLDSTVVRAHQHAAGAKEEWIDGDPTDLLELDEALQKLEAEQPSKAHLVKLRYFAGCSLEEAASILGVSRATAQRQWAYARAWLFGQLNDR